MKIKRICILGILTAVSMIFAYVESLIPVLPAIPGVKLGLANLCVLLCLYQRKTSDAFLVLVLRIVLTAFTFGSLFSMLYALAGGLCSFCVMLLARRSGVFSLIGVSILGGVTHNMAQLAVACDLLQPKACLVYLPHLLVFGAVCGFLIGILTKEISARISLQDERAGKNIRRQG